MTEAPISHEATDAANDGWEEGKQQPLRKLANHKKVDVIRRCDAAEAVATECGGMCNALHTQGGVGEQIMRTAVRMHDHRLERHVRMFTGGWDTRTVALAVSHL